MATKHRTVGGGQSQSTRRAPNSKAVKAQPFSTSYSSSNVRAEASRIANGGTSSSIAARYGVAEAHSAGKGRGGTAAAKNEQKDSVIFAIDPKQPQCPIVFRDEKSKAVSRERLNLDNRNLSGCPLLRGEDGLRLLNYENNMISRISNLQNLRNLIFLDLYNNRVSKMENLHCVPMLRVLMLGRNQIARIENLETLRCLDVLDLHSNQIAKIENLGHLAQLRVLNLAANDISKIENIETLRNLVELNLRRNQIQRSESFAPHQKLQRILLSNNNLRDIKAIAPIAAAKAIQQLTTDQNPFYELKHSKTTRREPNVYDNSANAKLVRMFPALRQLNNYDISDAVRKQLVAAHPELADHDAAKRHTVPAAAARNDDGDNNHNARSSSSSSSATSLSSASATTSSRTTHSVGGAEITPKEWDHRDLDRLLSQNSDLKENQLNADNKEPSQTPESAQSVSEDAESSSVIEHIPMRLKELTSDELISKIEAQWHHRNSLRAKGSCSKIEGLQRPKSERLKHFELDSENTRILRMFGCGMPRMETDAYYSSIEQLHFHLIEFNEITKYFNYIKTLGTVTTLKFHHNNIHSLYQIDALSVISQIKEVDFGAENGSNPITKTSPSLYRLYCIFRLQNVVAIDHRKVTAEERDCAKSLFSALRNEWKNGRILKTRGFCAPILNEMRNVNEAQTLHFKQNINEIFQQFPFEQQEENEKEEDHQMDSDEMSEFIGHKTKAQQSIERAITIFRAKQKLRTLWPAIVAEYVQEVINDLQAT